LTVEVCFSQPRIAPVSVSSMREPIDCTSIRLDSPSRISIAPAFWINLEQVTTSLNNEQHSEYVAAPTTPPPSYNKADYLFSQGTFTDCPICGNRKSVFNLNYCTQCGHSSIVLELHSPSF
jgi:hypothetical protein